jgi:tetratricopeptide (TPR) repeat protein
MKTNVLPAHRTAALLFTGLVLAAAVSAKAVDTVVTRDGASIRGALVSISPEGIEIEDRSGVKKVSIVDVQELVFDGEPDSLRGARRLLIRRDPRGAVEELAKIEPAELKDLDPRVREEYDFIKLASAASAAAAADATALEKPLAEFLQKNSRSHHLYAGYELLGDLFARQKKYPQAAEAYTNLDRGPPALRVRSASARAALLQQQGKFSEAVKEFEAAEKIATDPSDAASARQKREAALGRARCLAQSGKAAEGVAVVKQAIRDAGVKDGLVQDKDLLAAAFTALGACQRAAGGMDEDARISFLTVDLVYNQVPAAHAESLANLVELWNAANQPERARDAAQVLATSYPDSPWAGKLAGSGKAS